MCLHLSAPKLTQETDPLSETFIQFITVHSYENPLERCHAICMRQGRTTTEISVNLYFSLVWTQSKHF
jgi:hypothetical protein